MVGEHVYALDSLKQDPYVNSKVSTISSESAVTSLEKMEIEELRREVCKLEDELRLNN